MTACSPDVRPLSPESAYECDWGGCDHVAVAERRTDDHGWLPVCCCHLGGGT